MSYSWNIAFSRSISHVIRVIGIKLVVVRNVSHYSCVIRVLLPPGRLGALVHVVSVRPGDIRSTLQVRVARILAWDRTWRDLDAGRWASSDAARRFETECSDVVPRCGNTLRYHFYRIQHLSNRDENKLHYIFKFFKCDDQFNGVFLKWSRTFTEISEFRKSYKSLKHELVSV